MIKKLLKALFSREIEIAPGVLLNDIQELEAATHKLLTNREKDYIKLQRLKPGYLLSINRPQSETKSPDTEGYVETDGFIVKGTDWCHQWKEAVNAQIGNCPI